MRTWININLLRSAPGNHTQLGTGWRPAVPGSPAGAEGMERLPSLDFRQLNLQFNLAKTEFVAFV